MRSAPTWPSGLRLGLYTPTGTIALRSVIPARLPWCTTGAPVRGICTATSARGVPAAGFAISGCRAL